MGYHCVNPVHLVIMVTFLPRFMRNSSTAHFCMEKCGKKCVMFKRGQHIFISLNAASTVSHLEHIHTERAGVHWAGRQGENKRCDTKRKVGNELENTHTHTHTTGAHTVTDTFAITDVRKIVLGVCIFWTFNNSDQDKRCYRVFLCLKQPF